MIKLIKMQSFTREYKIDYFCRIDDILEVFVKRIELGLHVSQHQPSPSLIILMKFISLFTMLNFGILYASVSISTDNFSLHQVFKIFDYY